MILDPIVSVHPDELFFEVFSKDEGSYAKLGVDWSALGGGEEEAVRTTTNIDFSDALHDGVQRMRSYRATRIAVAKEAVKLETAGAPAVMEKKVSGAPTRGCAGASFQVQSAGALPRTVVHLAPIGSLRNVLRHLRLHGDLKKGGRGVRFELVPGEPPRLVLEPWETVLTTTAGVYARAARPR